VIELGKYNNLIIKRETDNGLYLNKDEFEVLLPKKYIPPFWNFGDEILVFCYKDSQDRIVAVTGEPYIFLNQFGYLEVKDVNKIGAFLDWGLPKELLCPFSLQNEKMEVGNKYLVYLLFDQVTERLIATNKLRGWFEFTNHQVTEGGECDVLVYGKTELGYKCVVNNRYQGLIYFSDVFQTINEGDRTKGYVQKIREDGKLDISLRSTGVELMDGDAKKLHDYIVAKGGTIELTDKSSPEAIKEALQMSKKSFKRAVGNLYKKGQIKLDPSSIALIEGNPS